MITAVLGRPGTQFTVDGITHQMGERYFELYAGTPVVEGSAIASFVYHTMLSQQPPSQSPSAKALQPLTTGLQLLNLFSTLSGSTETQRKVSAVSSTLEKIGRL